MVEVIYETHDMIHKVEMDIYENRGLFNDLYVRAIDVRVPCEETFGNHAAYNRMRDEGTGYFVQHYCHAYNFKDKRTRQLFKKAADAMNELEAYLQQFEDDGD